VKFIPCRGGVRRPLLASMLAGSLVWMAACGPEDYQKPILGFQNAANTVIAADRAFLNNENTNEQIHYINQRVFERQPLKQIEVEAQTLISPDEIKLRTEALDALSQYLTSLATLAGGKGDASTGQDMKASGDKLQASATAENSKGGSSKTETEFSKKFSGIATAAAAAIGVVAQAVLAHRARNEIKKSVQDSDAAIAELIGLISRDAQGSYLRQKDQLGALSVQLYNGYKCEIAVDDVSSAPPAKDEVKCPTRAKGVQADPVALLALADRLTALEAQKATLQQANPAAAIAQMQKAHEALVAYVKSDKNPQTLSDLITSVKNFVNSVQPLEKAVQGLVTSAK
jgi:hypothetical protein